MVQLNTGYIPSAEKCSALRITSPSPRRKGLVVPTFGHKKIFFTCLSVFSSTQVVIKLDRYCGFVDKLSQYVTSLYTLLLSTLRLSTLLLYTPLIYPDSFKSSNVVNTTPTSNPPLQASEQLRGTHCPRHNAKQRSNMVMQAMWSYLRQQHANRIALPNRMRCPSQHVLVHQRDPHRRPPGQRSSIQDARRIHPCPRQRRRSRGIQLRQRGECNAQIHNLSSDAPYRALNGAGIGVEVQAQSYVLPTLNLTKLLSLTPPQVQRRFVGPSWPAAHPDTSTKPQRWPPGTLRSTRRAGSPMPETHCPLPRF